MRILSTESLRVPGEGSSAQGQSGPKLRPKGVGEGQLVEIPVPPRSRLSDGVTQEDRESGLLDGRVSSEAEEQANPLLIRLSCDAEGNRSTEVPDFTLPRKASSE